MSDEGPKTEQTPPPLLDGAGIGEVARAALGAAMSTPAGAASPGDRNEIELPTGSKASILKKWKGKHVLQASRAAGGMADQMRFVFGIIAVKTLIDGAAITIEDIDEMDGDDVMKLIGAAMGNGNTSSSAT